MNIEFRIWKDGERVERVLRSVMDVNEKPGDALELLLAAARKEFVSFTGNRTVHHLSHSLKNLDDCAGNIEAAARIYCCNRWQVARSLGRENGGADPAMLKTMKDVVDFVAEVVHKLQTLQYDEPKRRAMREPSHSHGEPSQAYRQRHEREEKQRLEWEYQGQLHQERELREHLIKYAMFFCEQANAMVGPYNDYSLDHPEAMRWLNITMRVQQRMIKLWEEAVALAEAKKAKLAKKRSGYGVTVQLLRGETILAGEWMTIVTGHVPRFAIGAGEKLRFKFDEPYAVEQTNLWNGQTIVSDRVMEFVHPFPERDQHALMVVMTEFGQINVTVTRRDETTTDGWFTTAGN